jgi:hypothetical protein
MTLSQRFTAYLAMLALGLPTVLIALVGGESWPFLDYRMYAEAKLTPDIDWLEVKGRTTAGEEISLHHESYLTPFDPADFLMALYSLDILGETDPAPARRALREVFNIYEARRREREHNGPALTALTVYRVRWSAPPGVATRPSPDERYPLLSVWAPSPTARPAPPRPEQRQP